ncbi:MAG: type II toxin-antitoxin system RelE/ParE family toxin [Methanomicrobiales archaeon]
MFEIMVSKTFEKQFHSLTEDDQKRIRQGLPVLAEDPFTPRSGADIKSLQQTLPKKYRLRIGELRIIYSIRNETILIIEVFRRGQGYS